MTATATRTRPQVGAGVVVVGACALLLARPALLDGRADPTMILVAVFVVIGLAGATWPSPSAPHSQRTRLAASLAVTAAGMAVFGLARLAGGHPVAVLALRPVALNSLAAVAEEAVFRRLLYGLLRPGGAVLAVAGSATAFAAVHVTVWGAWVLPLDLAAGLLLGWQREATGRWSVPAATHVFANLVAVL